MVYLPEPSTLLVHRAINTTQQNNNMYTAFVPQSAVPADLLSKSKVCIYVPTVGDVDTGAASVIPVAINLYRCGTKSQQLTVGWICFKDIII